MNFKFARRIIYAKLRNRCLMAAGPFFFIGGNKALFVYGPTAWAERKGSSHKCIGGVAAVSFRY